MSKLKLSFAAQTLLNELVQDLKITMSEKERTFDVKDRSSYIYNLFQGQFNWVVEKDEMFYVSGKYKFSLSTYKELFEYLANYKESWTKKVQSYFRKLIATVTTASTWKGIWKSISNRFRFIINGNLTTSK